MPIEIKNTSPEASFLASLIDKRRNHLILTITADRKRVESEKTHGFVGITPNEILLQNMSGTFRRIAVEAEMEIRELFLKTPPSEPNSQS